jgi:hypothetical protein
VISRLELLLLLSASDRDANLDAVENLLELGLVVAVIDRDLVVGVRTTQRCDAALKARTLPTAQS